MRGGQGGARRAWLCVRVRQWELVSLGARGRGWEGESADVHTGEAVGVLSAPKGGSGAPKPCPPLMFFGARLGQCGHGCVYVRVRH